MLNKIIEKGAVKCHQYWPVNAGDSYELESVGLQLTHIESTPGQHYTVRTFKLTNTETGESREIFHFHYINWPDFGVPQCPDSFLEYLQAVRDSGSLEDEVGPAVVHCSAGIGRSGTFCLVDTCLVLVSVIFDVYVLLRKNLHTRFEFVQYLSACTCKKRSKELLKKYLKDAADLPTLIDRM